MAQDPLSRVASWLAPARPQSMSTDGDPPAMDREAEQRLGRILDEIDELSRKSQGTPAEWRLVEAFRRWLPEYRASTPAHPDAPVDPVLALITEEERIRCAAIDLSDAADLLFYALPQAEQEKLRPMEQCRLPGEMGDLYRRSEPLYEEANQLFDRIRETKPVTLAGAIAMLESGDEELLDLVLEFLRDLQAKREPPDKAVAATVEADDSKILSLFRDWMEAKRLSWAVPDDEFEAAAVVADKIEDAIIATASSGAVGFAIKTYLLLRIENGHDEDGAALGNKLNWKTLEASILRDLIRFVPELAPLAAAALDGQPNEQS
jgi:hypothetical protein